MGVLSAAAKAAKAARAAERAAPGGLIRDWQWLPEAEVNSRVGLKEVPSYIQDNYGKFMAEQGQRAKGGKVGARDLAKAYGVTRSSVGRAARTINDDLSGGSIRPEGYMSEWLLSPQGRAYLDDAQRGVANTGAITDIVNRFKPFGMADTLGTDLQYGAVTLPGRVSDLQKALNGPVSDWREFAQSLDGIGPAKSGFVASLLGRGDLPTLDARQLVLQTGAPAKAASKYMARGNGLGGDQAVDRLAQRQANMGLKLAPTLEPYRQHLTHHAIWDAVGGTQTTHDDIVRAMRLAGIGAGVVGGSAVGGLLGEEPD